MNPLCNLKQPESNKTKATKKKEKNKKKKQTKGDTTEAK